MAGIGTDVTVLFLGSPENLFVATLAGIFGNLSKFLVNGDRLGQRRTAWIRGAGIGAFIDQLYRLRRFRGLLGGLTLIALRKAGFFTYLEESVKFPIRPDKMDNGKGTCFT